MRKNLTKERIKAGKTAYGVFVPMWCPAIIEIIGHIGFDFVIFDAEHGPMGVESCEHMVRAADTVNITPIIRVAVNLQQNILRYLDIGALGVQMPMINNKADAERVVQAVKYRPEGSRGLAAVRAANYGLTGSLGDYVREANRETLVAIHVETMQAVDNLKETLTVPGIDVIFIGPTDLSSAMGYPGEVSHPEVQQKIGRLVQEIRSAGKAAGTIAYDLDTLRRCKERGFQYIAYNVGPMIVKSGREYLQVARE
ncbi:MAG: 2-keto-3-deoxy-L-rhamnonate aldolase [Dehalococcoidia bacterium]|nr:2-keto-3-deoxy-L-rhamnonate aldolase [Bacillota bacterium]